MKIFPAIDIKDKKCVRLVKGDFGNKTEYETSPIDQAGKFKDQIALGLDAKDGSLLVSGWKENINIKTIDFLREVNSYGVSRIIYTDINRDGMKTSPNFDETLKIAEFSNCPVVISGGVSSINDIKKAKELNNKKIEGIIVGKAIYDGDIKLDELVREIIA